MGIAKRVLFIGCGRLGKCFLELYTKENIFQEIVIVQPSLASKKDFFKSRFFRSTKELPQDFSPDIVFLLVKPNKIASVLLELKHLPKEVLFISCAAMTSMAFMQHILPEHKIVRVMPNTGLKVRKSLTLGFGNSDKELVEQIFSYSGGLFWVEKEELIEKLTPLTGSGPALFFQLTSALEKKIIECSIKPNDARKLAISVLEASTLLAKKNSDLNSLIDEISSKGGITEAMLSCFTPLLSDALNKTIECSTKKIKELTK